MKEGYREVIVYSNKQIASNVYEMKVVSDKDELRFEGKSGQFYMVRGWESLDPYLSRPISICNIEEDRLTFLYEVRGKGTHLISTLEFGHSLEILGPLGNGFNINIKGNIALVSGGIGIAPMIYLAKSLHANVDFYCGFRNEIYYIDEIEENVENIFISTEDGSKGYNGFITEILKPEQYDVIFTCGPSPMMKRVVEMCKGKVRVYASMESRIACGIGACLGCTIETKSGIKRICKEGPVFYGEEVLFND